MEVNTVPAQGIIAAGGLVKHALGAGGGGTDSLPV